MTDHLDPEAAGTGSDESGAPPPPWETAHASEPPAVMSLTLRTSWRHGGNYVAATAMPIAWFVVTRGAPNGAWLTILASLMVAAIPLYWFVLLRNVGLPNQPFVVIEPTELRWVRPLGRKPVPLDGLGDLCINKRAFPSRGRYLCRCSDGRRLVNLDVVRLTDLRALRRVAESAQPPPSG